MPLKSCDVRRFRITWLAALAGVAGLAEIRRNVAALRGQNKLAVTRHAQTILATRVLDDQLIAAAKKLVAVRASRRRLLSGCARRRSRKDFPGFLVFDHLMPFAAYL
jgi:hypothetical protein